MLLKKWVSAFWAWILKQDAIFAIFGAFVSNRAIGWLPKYYYIHPFPLYEIVDENGKAIGLTLQSYAGFISQHLLTLSFWYYCRIKLHDKAQLFYKFIAIEIASLLDFGLIYEHDWFHIGTYGVQFTDFKIFLYLYFFILWTLKKL